MKNAEKLFDDEFILKRQISLGRTIDLIFLECQFTFEIDSDGDFTTKQVSRLLDKPVATIYKLIHRGEISVHKRGNIFYFSKQDLLMWASEELRKLKEESKIEYEHYLSKNKRGK